MWEEEEVEGEEKKEDVGLSFLSFSSTHPPYNYLFMFTHIHVPHSHSL